MFTQKAGVTVLASVAMPARITEKMAYLLGEINMGDTSTSDIEQYVQEKITSGDFDSREQFALEAIRLYREIEREFYAGLRTEVQKREQEMRDGKVAPLDMEAIIAKGKGLLAERRRAS